MAKSEKPGPRSSVSWGKHLRRKQELPEERKKV